jgi:hypothetical protein
MVFREFPMVVSTILLVLLSAMSTRVIAHEISPAIATLVAEEDGALRVTILLNLEATIAGLAPGHDATDDDARMTRYASLRSISPAVLHAEFEHFSVEFLAGVHLLSGERKVALKVLTLEVPETGDVRLPRRSSITLAGTPEGSPRDLTWQLDPTFGDNVIRLLDPRSQEVVSAQMISAGERSDALVLGVVQPLPWTQVFNRYLVLGFTHILPKGLDHILFIVGLFLLAVRLPALVTQVTTFTVAHTVTLGLSMVDVVRLSPLLVEPLIAASIVYVAIENIATDRVRAWRLAVVFAFGLLHGLGFAGVLQEIGTMPDQFLASLVAFNLGVELGQLTVLGICLLALGWCVRRSWYRSRVAIPASTALAIVGTVWFVERVGLL